MYNCEQKQILNMKNVTYILIKRNGIQISIHDTQCINRNSPTYFHLLHMHINSQHHRPS